MVDTDALQWGEYSLYLVLRLGKPHADFCIRTNQVHLFCREFDLYDDAPDNIPPRKNERGKIRRHGNEVNVLGSMGGVYLWWIRLD